VRGYAYNVSPCLYSNTTTCPSYNTLLGVVPNYNYTGGSPSQGFQTSGFTGVSNQNIPYLQGNLALNYTLRNGAFAEIGETVYGKNNSLNEPPFGIGYLTVRYPISHSIALQISGDNIFNAYSNIFPTVGAGVPIPLAGSPFSQQFGAPAGTLLPAQGATTAGNLGPANWRFIITKNIGPEPNP